jgi:hypothetical protein
MAVRPNFIQNEFVKSEFEWLNISSNCY